MSGSSISVMAATGRGSEASKRVISETQRLYGYLLAQPLDEKQLARPSFKLIQNIAKSLITETRTLRNVFNASDFESENKTLDKRKRTEFVQKLIDFAANHKQPVVACVAAKIVAGLEPNKTNELLQSLAKIALVKIKGQDPNRPKTFTKQSPGPASLQKASASSAQAVSANGRRQSETQQQVAVSAERLLKSSLKARESPAKTIGRRASGDRSRLRDTSGSSSRNVSPVTGKQPTSVSGSATKAHRQAKDSKVLSQQEVEDSKSELDDSLKNDETNLSSETRKLSGTLRPSIQQFPVTSESDIGKHLPQLRSSLKNLNTTLVDISSLTDVLKERLTNC